jgi:Cu(I)/Ag(I) efflux system membrane fusion protein
MSATPMNPQPPQGGAAQPQAAGREPAPPAPGHQPPPPGAHFMNILRWVLFAGLLALAVASIASYVAWKLPKPAATRSARKVIYQCPMHPSYTSDKPGECPICGMTLEPVVQADAHAAAGHAGDVPGLAAVNIPPERVQLIGVRTARVQRRTLGGQLELVGFVAPDETRLKRVQLRVSGWVQELFVNRTGERVAAGQPLLSIYSPELYQSEREFLIELGSRDSTAGMSHEAGASAAARERLRLLGLPDEEIARLERERTAVTRLTLRSPVSGTVLERGVAEGQFVGADTPLFDLADLTRVWVLADLYEMDVARSHTGDRAAFVADALPNHPYAARVEFVYPTVSNETRTLKLRLSLDNRDGMLRPGMYGRVRVTGEGRPTLAIPAEAVVGTGEHDYVFIARGGGHFEPRIVKKGLQDGDLVQILGGLAEGDTVVTSASFLIDSESRLKAAIAGMGQQPGAGHQHGGPQ